MISASEKKSLTIILSVFFFVIISTWGVTLLARGYRPALQSGGLSLNPTGLLSATSVPKSASVYINNSLITATDDTINLSPGEYIVKIIKDGYFNWQKNIKIKTEVVYQTDAQLFRSTPDLKTLTSSGVVNPVVSPDKTKIIFAVASASAVSNNGLYIVELSANPLNINKNIPRQIAPNTNQVDWTKATFEFSPNSTQIIASFKKNSPSYLLDLNTTIDTKKLIDIGARISFIHQDWDIQNNELIAAKIDRLPPELRPFVATASAEKISFNTLEDKVLYQASSNSEIPLLITPPPAQSTQIQNRKLIASDYYVYDLLEDTNFHLGSPTNIQNPFWLPNSNDIAYLYKQEIRACDYDNTNLVTLYAGNLNANLILPWSDGHKIITLTTPYTGSSENLYTITIR
ncbi:MAG: PEGA domain-containing protein [Microgenomates group bacterium]